VTQSHFTITVRIVRASKRWLNRRMQEFTHCSECDNAINFWTSRCPNCGQANPVRVSSSIGIFLTLGTVLLTSALCFLTMVN
jgi:hypothetical protein